MRLSVPIVKGQIFLLSATSFPGQKYFYGSTFRLAKENHYGGADESARKISACWRVNTVFSQIEAAFFPTGNNRSRVFLSSYHYDFYFTYIGVAIKTTKASLDYKPYFCPAETSRSIQENTVLLKSEASQTP